MDEMVKATQEWLNKTYKGEKDFTPFEEKDIDGITGAGTFKRLIQALQIEINKQYGKNIKVDGDFGDGTLKALPATIGKSNTKNNIVHIIQSSLWCKGYSAGAMDGIYGDSTSSAVLSFQVDAGIPGDGIIKPYVLQGIMNTDAYFYQGPYDSEKYYKHLVQKAMNRYYGARIGLTASNGIWERKAHKNLIKCCQIEWGLTPDGVFGTNTMNAAPTLSKNKNGYTASKRLLKWGLTVNGFYPGNVEDGTFDTKVYNAVHDFQGFLELGADGIAGKNTWASLLSSRGNTARKVTACDTSKPLSYDEVVMLKNNGYSEVGRYLTNTPGSTLNKKLTREELNNFLKANMRVFPIFQTSGRKNTYFSSEQGKSDALTAKRAAKRLGFPKDTVIYFAADYDVTVKDLDSYLLPYFRAVKKNLGKFYKIGVYGPRMLCTKLSNEQLTSLSFVSDMSSGFTGNIGQKMPENWAYDQILETKVETLGIDKCVASGRATAIDPKFIYSFYDEDMLNLEYFEALYNHAVEYIKQNYNIDNIVFAANTLCLKFLRSKDYNGVAWAKICGPLDTAFNTTVTYKNLGINSVDDFVDCKEFCITEAGKTISIEHLAATLNAYLHKSENNDENERVLDSYAGWAGDLISMCGAINDTSKMIYNSPELPTFIGDNDGKFKFSYEDLVQDVDALNLSKNYDWNKMSISEIFEDYYCFEQCKRRFSIFKENLLSDFSCNTLVEVVEIFTENDYTSYAALFGLKFGLCPTEYAKTVSSAFASRVEMLIKEE